MQHRNASALLLAVVLGLCSSSWAVAQARDAGDEFHWTGRLAADKVVEVRNINGFIRADGVSGDQIEVSGVKTGPDRNQVRVEVKDMPDGVLICAVYPGGTCEPGRESHADTHSVHAAVNFTVHLPRTLRFTARNVNGQVEASDLGRYVDASTVNGPIDISTASWAKASSVNGAVRARMDRGDWPGTLKFSTVNGSIEVDLPANLNADIKASSVNGRIDTDFPLNVHGAFAHHSAEGRIGSGGRELDVSTVNGAIRLRKGGGAL